MAFHDTNNMYHRTTIIIDTFDDGTSVLRENERTCVLPPCVVGDGCRASSYKQEACEFDPRTGYCGGKMP